jgi:DNA-damage-inducible protein J
MSNENKKINETKEPVKQNTTPTIINVKISDDEKNQFSSLCSKMGLSISAAILLYVKKVIQTEKIPFAIGNEDIVTANKQANITKDDAISMLNSQTTIIQEQIKKIQEFIEKKKQS